MKYLFILLIIGILFILLYRRLRPYLQTAQHMLGVIREVRRMSQQPTAEQPTQRRTTASADRLVRCAACGTWIPASRALKSHSAQSYCSSACLTSAAENIRQKRTGSR